MINMSADENGGYEEILSEVPTVLKPLVNIALQHKKQTTVDIEKSLDERDEEIDRLRKENEELRDELFFCKRLSIS
jgi:hypothetical protein